MEKLLTYQEIAEKLGYSVRTIKYWVHTNYIPYIPLGVGRRPSVRFFESEVIDWLRKRKCNGRRDFKNPYS